MSTHTDPMEFRPERHGAFRRILVPLDGSKLAEQALGPAATLARAFDGQLTLLRATEPLQTLMARLTPLDMPSICDPVEIARVEVVRTREYLEAVTDRLRAQGLDAEFEQLEGHPADAICAEARRLGADVIVLTSHGRTGWRHLVFGSVADEVIRNGCCPVLVVHVTE